MGPVFIAFILAIGASTWIYTKLNRSTGGNVQNSAIGTAISGVLIFLVAWMLLRMFV